MYMEKMKYFVCILFMVAGISADYFHSEHLNGTDLYDDEPYWSTVSVTWCPDPTAGPHCFEEMPKTAYDAIKKGWKLISDDCENYGRYNGYRYVYDNDFSLVLLYDRYGFISGVQTHMLIKQLTSCYSFSNFFYQFSHVSYFLKTKYSSKEYYTLTAYFQNPRTICDSGRSLPEYFEEGIGNGLWLQHGDNPYINQFVPTYRPAAEKKYWERAQCVDAMGHHNFYYMHRWPYDNCATIPPYAILYDNDDYMKGFVFMVMGNATSEYDRFEKLPSDAVKFVMNGDDAPPCVKEFQDECGLTTMHVYFVKNPSEYKCEVAPSGR